jgi:Tol biopolymer transport system component
MRVVSGYAFRAVLTPDSKYVVFSSDRSGSQTPWIVALDGGEPREVTKRYAATYLDVSHDNQLLLGTADDAGKRSIVYCQLPACATFRTVPGGAGDAGSGRPKWSPDGRAVAYFEPAADNIWMQPLDGTPRYPLTNFTDGRTIADFAWSSDGKHLAVARSLVTNDIVLFRSF